MSIDDTSFLYSYNKNRRIIKSHTKASNFNKAGRNTKLLQILQQLKKDTKMGQKVPLIDLSSS